LHFDCTPSASTVRGVLERAQRANPAAVVLIAGASDSTQLLRTLRTVGYEGNVFGGPWMGRRAFVEEAGPVAEGVKFPYLLTPSPRFVKFAQRFAQRFGRPPDYAAAHMYDTVSLLVAALRRAGLDRTGIRDAVRELSPWSGVTGEIRWDTAGANCRPVHLGMIDAHGKGMEIGGRKTGDK
jgi:branched-chain amino acid transport system substrate-binding protein